LASLEEFRSKRQFEQVTLHFIINALNHRLTFVFFSLKLVHVHTKLTPREGLSSKWIVVTTINYPTEAIKVFARQPGWKVVVVGDTKTPSDWRYPNCTYLSVQTQAELGYRITSILPFRFL
jgi:hypothetical protein